MLEGLKKVHFIGIGGYGMSALAYLLLKMGFSVSGSDSQQSKNTDRLVKEGANVYCGHKASLVQGVELVVYSTAIPDNNPELKAARQEGIPLWHRSHLLAEVMNKGFGLAVAGTHGKTTTTSMLSLILTSCGLDPTALIGGDVSFLGSNARYGQSGYVVAEACESDHSFLRYRPRIAVVTNIEADHLEYYDGNFDRLVDSYVEFINNTGPQGWAVLWGEDPVVQQILPRLKPRIFTYGLQGQVDFLVAESSLQELGSRFSLFNKGEKAASVSLKVPGRHNVLNATAALSVAHLLQVPLQQAANALTSFRGAGRRFEVLGKKHGIMVVDDYAHHPTEIKATLEAAHQTGRRVVAVFQPHRYTRTSFFLHDFARAFAKCHNLVLMDIFSAGEEPLQGVTSKALAEEIKKERACPVQVLSREKIIPFLLQIVKEGDLVVTMGAGDVWELGRSFWNELQQQKNLEYSHGSLPSQVSFKVR